MRCCIVIVCDIRYSINLIYRWDIGYLMFEKAIRSPFRFAYNITAISSHNNSRMCRHSISPKIYNNGANLGRTHA